MLLMVTLLGCLFRHGQLTPREEGQFRVGDLGGGWEWVQPGGADQAWYNPSILGSIYADSNCKHRHDDSTLVDSMRHLTAGLSPEAPQREEVFRLDGREALMQVMDVSLDGVDVRMGAVVLNKDHCTYDLVYLAPVNRFEDGWSDFVAMVSGFGVY